MRLQRSLTMRAIGGIVSLLVIANNLQGFFDRQSRASQRVIN